MIILYLGLGAVFLYYVIQFVLMVVEHDDYAKDHAPHHSTNSTWAAHTYQPWMRNVFDYADDHSTTKE